RHTSFSRDWSSDVCSSDLPGTPLDPERFNAEDLAERRASYGRAGYALQFMLDTSPSDAEKHPLKLKNLMVMDIDPEVAPIKLVRSEERRVGSQTDEEGEQG